MIVVTGAAGVIGRALMLATRAEGVPAIGISRENLDLASGVSLTSVFQSRPSAIVHLAAAVPHSTHYPDTDLSASRTRAIDRSVYEAAVAWGCRVVYTSSCSLYDKSNAEINTEDTPLSRNLTSPYLLSKRDGEALFSSLSTYCIIRVPAPLGPGLPDSVVAKRFLRQALSGRPISVWGSGNREQNFVDVRDIADLLLRACRSKINETLNAAADAPTTMIQLAQAFTRNIRGCSFVLEGISDPLEYQFARYANTRANELLEWRPAKSLDDSIQSMVAAP